MQLTFLRKRIKGVRASRRIERLHNALLILIIVAGLLGTTSRAAPDGPDAPTAPLVFLDPTEPRFSAFPQGMAGMMADYVPDYGTITLIGGYRSGGTPGTKVISRDIWRYDPDFDKLTRIHELPDGLALAAHAYAPAEGKIYLFGGVQESSGGVNGSTTIRTYHVATGDVETLSATLPAPRARASAVYVPQDNKIYIVGGTATSDPDQTPIPQVLAFDLSDHTISTTAISLPMPHADNRWGSAYYVEGAAPYDPDLPNGVDDPYVMDRIHDYIVVLGTHGTFLFNPSTGETKTLNQVRFAGVLGAATAFVPTRMRIWSAGGFDKDSATDLCFSQNVWSLDARLHSADPAYGGQASWIGSLRVVLPETPGMLYQSQNDGAAVYVPDQDRVLVFGGFLSYGPPSDVCDDGGVKYVWDQIPDPDQYITKIYGVSPEYAPEDDWTEPPLPTGSTAVRRAPVVISTITGISTPSDNLVAGKSFDLTLSDDGSLYEVALQAPYRLDDGSDAFFTRIISSTWPIGDPSKKTVHIPDDISPGADPRVVALCLVSVWRLTPPNCRETPLTLNPGGLHGWVNWDDEGVIKPAEGAMVELRDRDGAVLDTKPTSPSGYFNFCPPDPPAGPGKCLAIADYTLNIWKPFTLAIPRMFTPTTIEAAVVADKVTPVTVVLETTPTQGPLVSSLTPSLDGVPGADIGTFMSFKHLSSAVSVPTVTNTFTVETTQFMTQGITLETQSVRFELNGEIIIDTVGSDGWQAAFDMGKLDPGDNPLVVTARDIQGTAGDPVTYTIKAIAAKPLDASWVFAPDGGVTWNPADQSYTTRAIVPRLPSTGTSLRWPVDEYVFSVPLNHADTLDLGQLSAGLRQEFTKNSIELGQSAIVEVIEPGGAWKIVEDGDAGNTYIIRAGSAALDVYVDDPPHVTKFLGVIPLYSKLRADVEIIETFGIDGKWSVRGDGAIIYQSFMPHPELFQIQEQFKVYPRWPKGADEENTSPESYLVQSRRIDLCDLNFASVIPKGDLKTAVLVGDWMLDLQQQREANKQKAKEIENGTREPDEKEKRQIFCEWFPIYGFAVEENVFGNDVEFTLGLVGKFSGTVVLQGILNGDDWKLNEFRVVPRPELWVQAGTSISANFIIATGTAGVALQGIISYDQPIAFDGASVALVDPCVRFLLRLKLWAAYKIDYFIGEESDSVEWEKVFLDERIPSGCTMAPTESDDPPVRTIAGIQGVTSPRVMPEPAVAMASDGSLMRLWTEDVSGGFGEVNTALMYDYDGANGGSQRGMLFDNEGQHNPAVTFLDDDTALAVWSQISVPPSGAFDTLADLLAHQELYAATWDKNSGAWSAPVRLTNNSASDGRPQLAADPGSDKAMLVWVRDVDASEATKGDWQIVARHWNGASWEPEQVIANDPSSADLEPALAYRSDGSEAWLVWIREHDADFGTNGDRRLNYAVWNGAAWSAANEPADWPAGVLHTSLAFSPLSPKPLVAMTVVKPDGGQPGDPAEIGLDTMRLYAAWWGPAATSWDVQAVGETRGAWPKATIYTDDHALIILRAFGGGLADGPPSEGGQMGVAAGRLGDTEAHWGPPGVISTDDANLWQLSAATLPISDANPNGKVSFVGVRDTFQPTPQRWATPNWQAGALAPIQMIGDRQAGMLGGNATTGVFDMEDDMDGIDPWIQYVRLSNLQPAAGEIVTATAYIRNDELRPMGSTGTDRLTVALRRCVPPFSCDTQVIDQKTYQGEMLFNEVIAVDLTYRSSGRPEWLEVVLFNHPNDLDTSNNRYELMAGISENAVQELEASEGISNTMLLQWTPPLSLEDPPPTDWRYWVYRGPTYTGPWTLIALTTGTHYAEAGPPAGQVVYYRVCANDGNGPHSDFGERDCGTPASPNRHGPVAMDDRAFAIENTRISIDVLDNDDEPDGDPLTVTAVTQPEYGIASTDGAKVFYESSGGFEGLETFTYTVSDNTDGSDTGIVTVRVFPDVMTNYYVYLPLLTRNR